MKRVLFVAVGAVVCLAGCASKQVVNPSFPSAPGWTGMKSGRCPKVPDLELPPGTLCAVASAESINSYSLGIETASTRARTEMAAVLRSEVSGFTRAVQDSLSKMGEADETQKIGNLAQNLVEATLSGVTVPATYYDRELKVYFAMATVDATTLGKALLGLNEARGLSAAAKAEIEKRAASIVDDFERERERKNQ